MPKEIDNPVLSRSEFLNVAGSSKYPAAGWALQKLGISKETLASGFEYRAGPEKQMYPYQTVLGYDLARDPITGKSIVAWFDKGFYWTIMNLSSDGKPEGSCKYANVPDWKGKLPSAELVHLSNEDAYGLIMVGVKDLGMPAEFVLQKLDKEGNSLGAVTPLFEAGAQVDSCGAAYDTKRGQMLVIWKEDWATGCQGKILDINGNVLGDIPQLPHAWQWNRLDKVSLTYNKVSDKYVLAWMESASDQDISGKVAKLVEINPNGGFEGEPIVITDKLVYGTSVYAHDGKTIVAWASKEDILGKPYKLQIGELQNGKIISTCLVDTATQGAIAQPAITYDGEKYLVSYTKTVPASGTFGMLSVSQIHSRVLGANLTPLSGVIEHNLPILGDDRFISTPLATSGDNPFTVMCRFPDGKSESWLCATDIVKTQIFKQYVPIISRPPSSK
jgi:hypothetical protein